MYLEAWRLFSVQYIQTLFTQDSGDSFKRVHGCIFKQSQFSFSKRTAFRGDYFEGGRVTVLGELWYDCLKRNFPYFGVTPPCHPNNTFSPFGRWFSPTLGSGCVLCLQTSNQVLKTWLGRQWELPSASVSAPAWHFSETHVGSRGGGSGFSLGQSPGQAELPFQIQQITETTWMPDNRGLVE